MRSITLKIDDIYIPADRRKELETERVDAAAEAMLNDDDNKPIQVRQGKDRYVLVKGIHRLEAHRALGEDTIEAYLVSARRH